MTPDSLAGPGNTQFQRAVQLVSQGRLGDANAILELSLKANPKQPDALHVMGVIRLQSGRPEDALPWLDRAIALNKRRADYWGHRGVACAMLGRRDDAIDSFTKTIRIDPRHAEARLNLGRLLLESGKCADAVLHLRRAVAAAPASVPAVALLGVALAGTKGADQEAEKLLRQAAESGFVPASRNLAAFLMERGRAPEAAEIARAAVARHPQDANLHESLGRALTALNQPEEAAASFHASLALAPGNVGAATGLGTVLSDTGRAAEAAGIYRAALAANPGHPRLTYNLGLALKRAGAISEALEYLAEAAHKLPGDATVAHDFSLALMTGGRLTEARDGFEKRFAKVPADTVWRDFPQAQWQGEPLSGKLLIWAEQGVGDHLLFTRLLPLVEARGITAVVECDDRVVAILGRSFPRHVFIPRQDPPDPQAVSHDIAAQCPMGSLMARLGLKTWTDLPDFPALVPDPARVDEMRHWLEALGPAPYIGVSWRSSRKAQGLDKSIPISAFARLLKTRNGVFVNLQYGDTDDEVARARTEGVDISTPPIDRFSDIEGLLALIHLLDGVVTTSNLTAHLAGAAGIETELLLPGPGLWYWGANLNRAPFYPSITIRRNVTLA